MHITIKSTKKKKFKCIITSMSVFLIVTKSGGEGKSAQHFKMFTIITHQCQVQIHGGAFPLSM